MQSLMQLMFGDFWDLNKSQIREKGKSISEFRLESICIRKIKKIATELKVPKNGLTEPPFGEYMFILLVQHPCKMKIY